MKRAGFTLPEVLFSILLLGATMLTVAQITGTALSHSNMAHRLLNLLLNVKNRIANIATFDQDELKEHADRCELKLTRVAIDPKKSELKELDKSITRITVEGKWQKVTVQLTTLVYRAQNDK